MVWSHAAGRWRGYIACAIGSLWEGTLRRCAAGTWLSLAHALIHLWLSVRCLPRLLCWCPRPSDGLWLLLLLLLLTWSRRADDGSRLLVCIDLVSLRSGCILSALCLEVRQGGCSGYTGCCESRFNAAAGWWNDGRLGRWRGSSLCFDSGCGSCGAQAIDASGVWDVKRLRSGLARRCSCSCSCARARARRGPVLLVVFGERIRLSAAAAAALSLRRFGKQPLLIWCLWARRIWQWLGRGSSALCKPRRLDRPVLVSPSISAYTGSIGVVRIEACALPWRERSGRCCV
jgi:hypothetical protein